MRAVSKAYPVWVTDGKSDKAHLDMLFADLTSAEVYTDHLNNHMFKRKKEAAYFTKINIYQYNKAEIRKHQNK